jgi:hypothetical protein
MSTHTTSHRCAALLAVLLVAVAVLPAAVSARPLDGPGMPHPDATPQPSAVVHTVVKEQRSAQALPIALAGAALVIAIAGTGYALMRMAPLRRQLGVGH